jgi:uncharacterized membrane protein
MYYYHFHQWLAFFYFYCVFGWCFESTYVSLKKGHFINRGFMKGPWLPLYGTGAICVLFVTLPFQSNWILVYLVGALAATILEYIVGALMVRLFKVRYWDYSYRKIQLNGHICLVSTIAWGFLSLLMVYVVHEPVAKFILSLNNDFVSVVTFLITIAMVFDFANAFRQAMDLRALIIQAEQIRENLHDRLELQAELVKASTEEKLTIINARRDYMMQYYGDQLRDKKADLQTALEPRFETSEQVAKIEALLEKDIFDLQELRQKMVQKMIRPASYVLRNNPGFKAPSLKKESIKLKELIKKETAK